MHWSVSPTTGGLRPSTLYGPGEIPNFWISVNHNQALTCIRCFSSKIVKAYTDTQRQCFLLGSSWSILPDVWASQNREMESSRFSLYVSSFLHSDQRQNNSIYWQTQAESFPLVSAQPFPLAPPSSGGHRLLHCVATVSFTAHLPTTGEPDSPNGAWNKIVAHAPMKPNKTSHYRDQKFYHYHGNWEAYSHELAGWQETGERRKRDGEEEV